MNIESLIKLWMHFNVLVKYFNEIKIRNSLMKNIDIVISKILQIQMVSLDFYNWLHKNITIEICYQLPHNLQDLSKSNCINRQYTNINGVSCSNTIAHNNKSIKILYSDATQRKGNIQSSFAFMVMRFLVYNLMQSGYDAQRMIQAEKIQSASGNKFSRIQLGILTIQ